jgi:type VI secretion system secreted protein VgrG
MAAAQAPMSIQIDGNANLQFRQMSWTDGLGQLPAAHIGLISEESSVDPLKVLGKVARVRLELPQGKERWFNGIVTRFSRGGAVGRYYEYQATVHPWLWLLTRTADCCIFEKMKVDAVLKSVFGRYPFADFDLRLNGTYPDMDYCVQYRETDFNFVNRMCERFGLYYHFEFSSDGHQKMVIVDSLSAHNENPGYESLPFHPATETQIDGEYVSTWDAHNLVSPGDFAVQDFNYLTSSLDLDEDARLAVGYTYDGFKVYDYPGKFTDASSGTAEAQLRLEASHAGYQTYSAATNAQGMLVGCRFKLTKHPDPLISDQKFVITGSTVSMMLAAYEAHGEDEPHFECHFESIPANTQFRPARVTPLPVVQGPQTAIVVGPKGEEIYTDQYGRVKVQFHWDHRGKQLTDSNGTAIPSEDLTCWLRVAQIWAGNRFGAVFIPRIGHEVVVDFLEGDPDRPLVTGCVYNDKNPPPWLPGAPTQSGILTRSSKQGSAANANALRFEDLKGSEEVWLHAEKDQRIEVEHDESHWVGNDRTKNVDHDEATQVKHNRTESVGNDESITIGNNRTENVGKDESVTIGNNRTESVGKDEKISIANNRTEDVGKDETVSIGNNRQVQIGKDLSSDIGQNETRHVAKDRSTNIDNNDLSQVGKKFALQAGDEIALVTGSASLVMKKDGTIQIKGKDITVEGSGKIGIKASGDVVIKGSKIAQN